MVLFLSTVGELSELHICEFSKTSPDGLGCLRPPLLVFVNLLGFELLRPAALSLDCAASVINVDQVFLLLPQRKPETAQGERNSYMGNALSTSLQQK